jgi:two-component system, response regulator YesN
VNECIKVLIVDDEYLSRNLLKNCIDWNSLNMDIAGEAEDADEALSLVDKLNPEVIFTDIQMPIIDGIQLSEMILKQKPGIKIVALTGFNDFDYAQRSIKAGISDYILKPINQAEVLRTALKVKQIVEQDRKNSSEYIKLRKELYNNLAFLKDKFLNELLNGSIDVSGYKERSAFLGIHFKYNSFQAAIIEILTLEKDQSEESRLIVNMKILNHVKNDLGDNRYIYVFLDTTNRIIILNNDENIDLYEKCEEMRENIIREIPCNLCIGVGRLKKEIGEISNSYKEALEAVNYRIAAGNNTVILYNNIHFHAMEPVGNINDLYVKLDFYIKTGLREKISETIDEIFNNIDIKDRTAIKTLRINTISITASCFQKLVESGLDSEEVYKLETQSYKQILLLETLPDIRTYLSGIMDKTIDTLNKHQNKKISSFIDKIKEYVRDNYADSNLSLASIAKLFYLNPSYLSRTFKKETSVSFIEYLTSVRIDKAIELLKESNLKVFAIAEAVGISDPNYFSTCFKKYSGVSISDFRKSLTKKES